MKIRGLYLKHGLFVYRPPQVNGHRPKPIHLSTANLSEALRKVQEIRDRDFQKRLAEPLADLVERYLREKRAGGEHKGEQTSATARPALNRLKRHFRRQASEITTADLRDWKAAMLAERKQDEDGNPTEEPLLSRATVAGYLRYAQSFFAWLAREGVILESPFAGARHLFPKSIPTQRERVCSKELRDQLLENCQDLDLKAVLFLGFHAGLRRNEILNLRPDWIERDEHGRPIRIRVQNVRDAGDGTGAFTIKDSEPKTIPVSDPLADFLVSEYQLAARIDREDAYLIRPDLKPGRHKYRWEFKRRWKTYMKAQGAEFVTVHTLRHTWVSLLLSSRAEVRPSLLHLARWSGTNVETLKKSYAHLFEDRDLINAAN